VTLFLLSLGLSFFHVDCRKSLPYCVEKTLQLGVARNLVSNSNLNCSVMMFMKFWHLSFCDCDFAFLSLT
jgi:hypothetical protein